MIIVSQDTKRPPSISCSDVVSVASSHQNERCSRMRDLDIIALHFVHVVIKGSTKASSNILVLPDFTSTDFSFVLYMASFETLLITFLNLSFFIYSVGEVGDARRRFLLVDLVSSNITRTRLSSSISSSTSILLL